MVGVSALIVTMGVMSGMQTDLREKILLGSPDLRVLPYGSEMRLPDWASLQQKIVSEKGVVAASPFVSTQAMVGVLRGRPTGAQVVGIEPEGANQIDVTTIRKTISQGDFTFRRDGISLPGAVLGKVLAATVGAFIGDTIVLLGAGNFDVNAATGAFIPQVDTAVVSGIFATDLYEYDNTYVYLDLPIAQRFARIGEDVTGIEVRTADRWIAPEVADSIRASLAFSSSIRTMDWQEQNRPLFQALKLEKLGMGVILLLIVLVAAFNIVSTLTMVVSEKTREIGILRAMGLPARSIRRIFLLQGTIIGAVGTLGGLTIGLLVSVLLERYHFISLDPSIYFIDHLPVRSEPLDILTTVAASLVVAALATLYPASQAAKLYPVDAIRHE